ncbi:hypothetical protein PFLUV_G00223700 [Perca fluviatilis]|uniref:Chemokine interleukin-8-like domain-containing protein n=1 Tax=Perca fluviatilis TaxID=8168 RepID=A0A6A5DRP3_PERFL|nr:hypothetical protein PFLUV_G00223700 [Perca fluviatilis]
MGTPHTTGPSATALPALSILPPLGCTESSSVSFNVRRQHNIQRTYIRELRFIHTPNCPFQVIAKLKTNKEVCVNPEIRWLQQYLKNAINKMKKSRQDN